MIYATYLFLRNEAEGRNVLCENKHNQIGVLCWSQERGGKINYISYALL